MLHISQSKECVVLSVFIPALRKAMTPNCTSPTTLWIQHLPLPGGGKICCCFDIFFLSVWVKLHEKPIPWKITGEGLCYTFMAPFVLPVKAWAYLHPGPQRWNSALPWQPTDVWFSAHCQSLRRQQWMLCWANYVGENRNWDEILSCSVYLHYSHLMHMCSEIGELLASEMQIAEQLALIFFFLLFLFIKNVWSCQSLILSKLSYHYIRYQKNKYWISSTWDIHPRASRPWREC